MDGRRRRYRLAWPYLLDALDDDQFAGFEPVRDGDVSTLDRPKLQPPLLNLIVLPDDEHIGPGLIDLQRGLRDHQRLSWLAGRDRYVDYLARDEPTVGIGEYGAHSQSVGGLIDLDVEKIDRAGVRIFLTVRQDRADNDVGASPRRLRGPLPIVEHLLRGRRKQDVDRILADDGRERAGRLVDEIADRDIGHADASVDRRLDLREGEIDVRLLQTSFGGAHGGRRRALIREVLIDRRLRARVGLDQFLRSLQRERRVALGRLRAGQLGLSLVERRLKGVLLDDEQEVAGFELLALGEGPLLQEALDARHQIDRVDRLDASDKRPGRSHAL